MTFPYDGSELDNDEPPLKKPWYRRRDTYLTWLLITLFSIFLVVMLLNRGDQTASSPPAPKERKVAELTLDDAFAALFRHLKADQICFVEGKEDSYFIHFDEDDTDNKYWAGWFHIDSPVFHLNKVNNTWFLYDIPASNFNKVWPNVDGMNCANRDDYEDK